MGKSILKSMNEKIICRALTSMQKDSLFFFHHLLLPEVLGCLEEDDASSCCPAWYFPQGEPEKASSSLHLLNNHSLQFNMFSSSCIHLILVCTPESSKREAITSYNSCPGHEFWGRSGVGSWRLQHFMLLPTLQPLRKQQPMILKAGI